MEVLPGEIQEICGSYLSNQYETRVSYLKQRLVSVIKYQREFTRFSKFAPNMVVTEEEKCRKFEDSLNDHIWAHVT